MNYQVKKFGNYRERRNYSKIGHFIELPNLIEIQTKSFKQFYESGMTKVFNQIFPIISHNKELELVFHGLKWKLPKVQEIKVAKKKGKNFDASLIIDIELINHKEIGKNKSIRNKELFFGNYPLMTKNGTFIINGSEKVIVSQLSRSQGVFFKHIEDELYQQKIVKLISAMIIPSRGTWIEFENSANGIINIRIDKNKKINAFTFLLAFGLKKTDLDNLFSTYLPYDFTLNAAAISNKDWIEATREVFKKIKQGDPISKEGSKQIMGSLFFEEKKYELSRPGRHKINQKLNIVNRAINYYSKDDLYNKNGELVFPKHTKFTNENKDKLEELIQEGSLKEVIKTQEESYGDVVIDKLNILVNLNQDKELILTSPKVKLNSKLSSMLTIADVICVFNYFLNLIEGYEGFDDIDDLANRRVRTINELLINQARIGLTRIEKNVKESMNTVNDKKTTIKNLINSKPLQAIMKEFFNTSQLSQFMDQTNLLSELTNKRRLTALGPNGLSRDRAGVEVRDVHNSHYGRLCPIETPEGPNIGLINNLSTYAKVNDLGFIETPYLKVNNGKIDPNSIEYLTADKEKEEGCYIGQANIKLENNNIVENEVIARYKGEILVVNKNKLKYMDVSSKQIISIATSCIPFVENDDANRALMGANMQRQAIPLLKPSSPLVGTGVEYAIARDSGLAIICKEDGKVTYVDGNKIIISNNLGKKKRYDLVSFERSNQGTCLTQTPLVKVDDEVKAGQLLTDGSSMENGELALGQNVLAGFMTWNGYNYEDAIIISERLVKDDIYTSLHIEEYSINCSETKLGEEEITRDIPNISENAIKNLDEDGVIMPGTEIKEGDILVGKITPKPVLETSSEEKILRLLFANKNHNVKDSSLRVPTGVKGVVQSIQILSKKEGDDLPNDVLKTIKVYIVQKRKIQEGDKVAGRHGNKGVISKILPIEDMPYLEDGTPLDIILNPLGVPSRMNIGQILELHLGLAAKKLNIHVATPVFEGMNINEISAIMKEAKIPADGKYTLYDGITGEKFKEKISLGYMYMLKLSHMVEDKIHSRNIGPYSLITQQPLGGKAQNGGQRFGEMEVWALEAYGASHLLQELLTIKSDDIKGRTNAYSAIIWKEKIPKPSTPESFLVLTRELKALGINVNLIKEEPEVDSPEKSEYLMNASIGEEGVRTNE